MSKKPSKRDEFRKKNDNEGTGHPTYIYAKIGNKFKYIGMTHSEITNGVKNIKLDKNPNPEDERDSYMHPTPQNADASRFGKKLKEWKLAESDKPKVDAIKSKKKKSDNN